MKVGLFGGTFDPVHIGHLIIAESAMETAGLDRVVFLPAARPPHKTDEKLSPFEDRLAMTSMAVKSSSYFEVSDLESRRPEISYTVDTLETYVKEHPDDRVFLILGADSLVNLTTWKNPNRLMELSRFIVYPRRGFDPEQADAVFRGHSILLTDPVVDVSASWIRERIRAGHCVRYWLPSGVYDYVTERQLYI